MSYRIITISLTDSTEPEKQIEAYEMIARGFEMLQGKTQSTIEGKEKHPHLHLVTKNINIHISKGENADKMKRFTRKSNQ